MHHYLTPISLLFFFGVTHIFAAYFFYINRQNTFRVYFIALYYRAYDPTFKYKFTDQPNVTTIYITILYAIYTLTYLYIYNRTHSQSSSCILYTNNTFSYSFSRSATWTWLFRQILSPKIPRPMLLSRKEVLLNWPAGLWLFINFICAIKLFHINWMCMGMGCVRACVCEFGNVCLNESVQATNEMLCLIFPPVFSSTIFCFRF